MEVHEIRIIQSKISLFPFSPQGNSSIRYIYWPWQILFLSSDFVPFFSTFFSYWKGTGPSQLWEHLLYSFTTVFWKWTLLRGDWVSSNFPICLHSFCKTSFSYDFDCECSGTFNFLNPQDFLFFFPEAMRFIISLMIRVSGTQCSNTTLITRVSMSIHHCFKVPSYLPSMIFAW